MTFFNSLADLADTVLCVIGFDLPKFTIAAIPTILMLGMALPYVV